MLITPDREYKSWIISSKGIWQRYVTYVDYFVYELCELSYKLPIWRLCHFKFSIILQTEGFDKPLNTINFAITLSSISLQLTSSHLQNYELQLHFNFCKCDCTPRLSEQKRSQITFKNLRPLNAYLNPLRSPSKHLQRHLFLTTLKPQIHSGCVIDLLG